MARLTGDRELVLLGANARTKCIISDSPPSLVINNVQTPWGPGAEAERNGSIEVRVKWLPVASTVDIDLDPVESRKQRADFDRFVALLTAGDRRVVAKSARPTVARDVSSGRGLPGDRSRPPSAALESNGATRGKQGFLSWYEYMCRACRRPAVNTDWNNVRARLCGMCAPRQASASPRRFVGPVVHAIRCARCNSVERRTVSSTVQPPRSGAPNCNRCVSSRPATDVAQARDVAVPGVDPDPRAQVSKSRRSTPNRRIGYESAAKPALSRCRHGLLPGWCATCGAGRKN
jgi:hypothetical protein